MVVQVRLHGVVRLRVTGGVGDAPLGSTWISLDRILLLVTECMLLAGMFVSIAPRVIT